MEWLSKVTEFLRLPLRYVWAIAIGTGLLLFGPEALPRALRLEKLLQNYGEYIGGVFFLSALLAVIHTTIAAWTTIARWRARSHRLGQSLIELTRLDPKEKEVLREFCLQRQSTLQLPVDQATVAGLIDKGILRIAGHIGERSLAGMLFPVTLSEHIRDYLAPELIDMPRQPLSDKDIEFLRENRPEFLAEIDHHKDVFHTTWRRRGL